MKNHTSLHFLQRLIRLGVPVVLLIMGSPPGKTQIKSPTASNPATLGTLVNGIEGGSCNSGTCAITGGKAKGNKLFHRLTEFWADSDYIDKVTVNNLQTPNKPYKSVIISNVDDYGTYLDTALEFTTSNSDLIILSPGGIKLGSEAHFTNIGSLALSTAENLVIGDEVFHFKDSTESDLINMTAVIDLAQSAFQHNQAEAGQISIEIDDTLSIDADLILHSIGGIDIKAAADSGASLDVAGTFNLVAHGKVKDEVEMSSSIEIIDTNVYANAALIEGNGSVKQSQGVLFESANIYTTDDIRITGIGGDETAEVNNESLAGLVLEEAELISSDGDILLKGVGGNGNQLISFGDYDFDFGSGLTINNSNIQTNYTNGLISLEGAGSFGSHVFTGHGVDINSTNLFADRIVAWGISAKASPEGKSDQSAGIIFDKSNSQAKSSITLIGASANTDPQNTDIAFSIGSVIQDSSFLTSAGPIKISGTGGSGESLVNSTGVSIHNTDIKGSKIELTGIGGKTSNPMDSNTSVGIDISGNSTLSTKSNENDSLPIFIDNQDEQINGAISINGYGGSGRRNSYGVFSTANIDSTGSIFIDGVGGEGQERIYGVALETLNDNVSDEIIKIITADDQITVVGKGGSGTDIINSNGIFLSNIEVYAGTGIYLEGQAGSSIGEHSHDKFLDGIFIESTKIKVNSAEAMSDIDNPNGKNIILHGTPGSSHYLVEGSSGVLIAESAITTKGGIEIVGDGSNSESLVSMDGDGILLEESTINASSLLLEGYGARPIEPGFIDKNGDLVEQTSTGVEIRQATIRIEDNTGDFDHSIDINGFGGGGNINVNGIILEDSMLTSPKLISLWGETNEVDTFIIEGRGISITDNSTLLSNSVDIYGEGSTGTSTAFSNGISINASFVAGTNDVRLSGKGGLALDDAGFAAAADGVSLVGGSSVKSNGDIYIDGKGGISTNETNITDGVYISDTLIEAQGKLDILGKGGGGQVVNTSNGVKITNQAKVYSGQKSLISGIGGNAIERVTETRGVSIEFGSQISSGGDIDISGKGGDSGFKATFSDGISASEATINSKGFLNIDGKGGASGNQLDSKDNRGIILAATSINGGRSLNFVGRGGTGGQNNTGIEFRDTSVTTDGMINFNGTGGEGTNIKKAIGVILGQDADEMIDDQIMGKLVGGSIFITGNGGTSNLRKNALDQNGKDTFGQTANNVGVVINQYELDANTGSLSVTGSGGELVVHKNQAEDQKISPNEESTAFKLEGLTIKASKTTSSQETFLKGSGGKPISGSKNSGTTITNSTIKSATSTDILPGPAVDLDIEDVNGIRLNNANANIESLENRIEGIAFSGTNEIYGLTIDNTKIESKNRSLTLSGKGGLKATGERNYGIYIHNGSSITVGSKNNSHDLKIYGAGGDGTDMTGGILTQNTSYTGFGKIDMVGQSLESSGALSDAIEIFNNNVFQSKGNATFSGNNNVNVSKSSIKTGGDLNFSAKKDLNIDNSKISTNKNLNATAGNDINIDSSKIDSEGDVNTNAGNDINIDNSKIDSEGDINATAGNDITVADSEINSNNTTLKADTIEIKETSLTSDKNLEIIAISGLDITSSELDASDAIALNSYSVAIESSTVKTSNLEVSSTELIQKESSFEANSFTVNDDQSSDNDGNGSVQSLGLGMNTSLQTVDSQANNPEPTQSNSELTMSLAGGVNYILDDSARESSSNDSQSRTNTSSSETTTSPATGSDESSSVDNELISSDGSADSESESEQAKSGGDDDQEGKDDAEDSSKDQKATKGSENSIPSRELSIKQAKQIHKESEAQSSKFVAKQLGLPERPAMSIQEIQGMLSSGMDSMNNNRQ